MSNAASGRTFSMGNNIGKVLSVILSQWLNCSKLYILVVGLTLPFSGRQ